MCKIWRLVSIFEHFHSSRGPLWPWASDICNCRVNGTAQISLTCERSSQGRLEVNRKVSHRSKVTHFFLFFWRAHRFLVLSFVLVHTGIVRQWPSNGCRYSGSAGAGQKISWGELSVRRGRLNAAGEALRATLALLNFTQAAWECTCYREWTPATIAHLLWRSQHFRREREETAEASSVWRKWASVIRFILFIIYLLILLSTYDTTYGSQKTTIRKQQVTSTRILVLADPKTHKGLNMREKKM